MKSIKIISLIGIAVLLFSFQQKKDNELTTAERKDRLEIIVRW